MLLIKKVESKRDNVIKYVFKHHLGGILEFSYINKNDGKDIICVPCQYMCVLGCKFCHCTDYIGAINPAIISWEEIVEGVQYIVSDLNLRENGKTLLVSFMGLGEPMFNHDQVILAIRSLYNQWIFNNKNIRFAIATCLPECKWPEFFDFTKRIAKMEAPVKLHFSLHYPYNTVRKEWMPNAWDIEPSLLACRLYNLITSNPVEIHYTLIDGVNDSIADASKLAQLLKNYNFTVKFLYFNEKESLEHKRSSYETYEAFGRVLDVYNIKHEYYIPPGLDIGASCGQFIIEEYL